MKFLSPCSFCLLLRDEQCGEGCREKGGFGDERTQVEEKENQVSHPEKKRSWNGDEGDRKRESLVGKNAQKQDGRIADLLPIGKRNTGTRGNGDRMQLHNSLQSWSSLRLLDIVSKCVSMPTPRPRRLSLRGSPGSEGQSPCSATGTSTFWTSQPFDESLSQNWEFGL